MGTKFLGTICPLGLNWFGTVCPEGPINWGPIVGDQMSGDHMCLEPNVSQPPESTSTHCVRPSYTARPKQEDTCLPIKSSRGHLPDYFTDPFFAKINYCAQTKLARVRLSILGKKGTLG